MPSVVVVGAVWWWNIGVETLCLNVVRLDASEPEIPALDTSELITQKPDVIIECHVIWSLHTSTSVTLEQAAHDTAKGRLLYLLFLYSTSRYLGRSIQYKQSIQNIHRKDPPVQ